MQTADTAQTADRTQTADRRPTADRTQTPDRAQTPDRVPAPRNASGYRGWRFSAPERITFVAACPSCGRDCDWEEQRHDTRLHAIVLCDCP